MSNIIAAASLPASAKKNQTVDRQRRHAGPGVRVILAAQIASDPAAFLAGANQAAEAFADSF
jgi:hypothetical protein